ncbi:MAG: hypothetical protein Q8Q73_05505 [Stagnimonas sp.]|nr:hypothetical protein [Stagnimonas sp.]
MSKTYRSETGANPRHRQPWLKADPDLDMIDYLDELELDRREAVLEFTNVQPTLAVDAHLH